MIYVRYSPKSWQKIYQLYFMTLCETSNLVDYNRLDQDEYIS